jgi:hypothetical protein
MSYSFFFCKLNLKLSRFDLVVRISGDYTDGRRVDLRSLRVRFDLLHPQFNSRSAHFHHLHNDFQAAQGPAQGEDLVSGE